MMVRTCTHRIILLFLIDILEEQIRTPPPAIETHINCFRKNELAVITLCLFDAFLILKDWHGFLERVSWQWS